MTNRSVRWPRGWPHKDREAWEQRGGSAALARSFTSLGWTPAETRVATRDIESLKSAVPHCPAALYRPLGVELEELLTAGAPELAADAVVTAATCSGSTREVWQLIAASQGWTLRRHSRTGRGTWQTSDKSLAAATPADALLQVPEIVTARHGQVQLFTTDEDLLPTAAMLELLRYSSPADKPAECPAAEAMAEDDEYLADEAADISWAPVWARVNGTRVTGIRADESPDGGTVTLVLVDPWEWPRAFIGTDSVASFSWFSEGGGAPTSWDGGSEITRLSPHLWLEQDWGDTAQGQQLHSTPATPEETADLIVEWVRRIDAEVFAALELEEFDPDGTLAQREQEHWQELLSEVEGSIHFNLPAAVLAFVRRRLAEDATYAATGEAVHNPTSSVGLRFRQALADAVESGVIGDLMWGEWQHPDRAQNPDATPSMSRSSLSIAAKDVPADSDEGPATPPSLVTFETGSPAVVKFDSLPRQTPPAHEHLQRWRDRGFGIAVYNSPGSTISARDHVFLSFGLEGAHIPSRKPPEYAPSQYTRRHSD